MDTLTKFLVVGNAADQEKAQLPREPRPNDFRASQEINMAPVTFEFLREGKWYMANESALRFLPGIRYLIFAFVNPISARPRINTYRDLIQPTVPTQTSP